MAGCTAPAPAKKVVKTARFTDDARSVAPAAHSDWRDWANLTEGPAGQIAERLLADDVADYLRFRAACGTWRRSTACPHARDGLDRRFHPRRWAMLPPTLQGGVRRRELLNATTGARIHVDLPELRHQHVLGPTSGGLLVICDKRTLAIRLLNPLTRHLTAGLPDATSLLRTPTDEQQELSRYRLQNLRLRGAGLANDEDSTLALNFHASWLVVAKPGDKRWRRLLLGATDNNGGWSFVVAALSFAGRFIIVTQNSIAALDTTAAEHPQLAPAVAQLGCEFSPYDSSVKLVSNDDDGELILVHRTPRDHNNGIVHKGYEVHRVDLDAGSTVPVRGLGGRALFVGEGRRGCNPALLVPPAGLSPHIFADTVYSCRDISWPVDCWPYINTYPLPCKPGFWYAGSSGRHARECGVVDSMARYVCCSETGVSPPRRSQRVAMQRQGKLSWLLDSPSWLEMPRRTSP